MGVAQRATRRARGPPRYQTRRGYQALFQGFGNVSKLFGKIAREAYRGEGQLITGVLCVLCVPRAFPGSTIRAGRGLCSQTRMRARGGDAPLLRRQCGIGRCERPSAGQGHPISSINEIRLNGRENFVLGKIIGGGMWALCTVTEISLRESPLGL